MQAVLQGGKWSKVQSPKWEDVIATNVAPVQRPMIALQWSPRFVFDFGLWTLDNGRISMFAVKTVKNPSISRENERVGNRLTVCYYRRRSYLKEKAAPR
jgi:hypothetical protein